MAKSRNYNKQIESERAGNLRTLINAQLKSAKTDAQKEILKSLKESLKGRRKLSESEYQYVKAELKGISEEIITQEKVTWKQKQRESAFRLEQKIALKDISKKKKKKKKKEVEDKRGKYGAIKYQKGQYTEAEQTQIKLNFLGIGERGITLSDGTTFTQDEFQNALEKTGVSIDRFFDTDIDIINIKYNPTRYNRWKQSINDDLKRLIASDELNEREKEGIERMTKLYGVFNQLSNDLL